jgi:hypothetical protein
MYCVSLCGTVVAVWDKSDVARRDVSGQLLEVHPPREPHRVFHAQLCTQVTELGDVRPRADDEELGARNVVSYRGHCTDDRLEAPVLSADGADVQEDEVGVDVDCGRVPVAELGRVHVVRDDGHLVRVGATVGDVVLFPLLDDGDDPVGRLHTGPLDAFESPDGRRDQVERGLRGHHPVGQTLPAAVLTDRFRPVLVEIGHDGNVSVAAPLERRPDQRQVVNVERVEPLASELVRDGPLPGQIHSLPQVVPPVHRFAEAPVLLVDGYPRDVEGSHPFPALFLPVVLAEQGDVESGGLERARLLADSDVCRIRTFQHHTDAHGLSDDEGAKEYGLFRGTVAE